MLATIITKIWISNWHIIKSSKSIIIIYDRVSPTDKWGKRNLNSPSPLCYRLPLLGDQEPFLFYPTVQFHESITPGWFHCRCTVFPTRAAVNSLTSAVMSRASQHLQGNSSHTSSINVWSINKCGTIGYALVCVCVKYKIWSSSGFIFCGLQWPWYQTFQEGGS